MLHASRSSGALHPIPSYRQSLNIRRRSVLCFIIDANCQIQCQTKFTSDFSFHFFYCFAGPYQRRATSHWEQFATEWNCRRVPNHLVVSAHLQYRRMATECPRCRRMLLQTHSIVMALTAAPMAATVTAVPRQTTETMKMRAWYPTVVSRRDANNVVAAWTAPYCCCHGRTIRARKMRSNWLHSGEGMAMSRSVNGKRTAFQM